MKQLSRIGLIGDVHQEHARLEVLLAYLAGRRVDLVLCVGDIADGVDDLSRTTQPVKGMSMKDAELRAERYLAQTARWPKTGRHILAQFDANTVVVYQAYAPPIGRFAAENGWFGGPFSYSRMSWIKPNFLWMMFRCGWATKPDQQVVLAVHLARKGFDAILAEAVHSTFVPGVHESQAQWTACVKASQVRLQWDPDHDPHGAKLERRAIQLGLRGDFLRRYGKEWIVHIDDISALVAEQYEHVRAGRVDQLVMPEEHVYPVADREVAARLGVDEWDDRRGALTAPS